MIAHLDYFTLLRSIGYLAAAVLVLVEARRLRLGLPRPALALAAWLVLRAIWGLVAPPAPSGFLTDIDRALDVATVAMLAYALFRGHRVAREAARSIDRAGQSVQAYEQARHDYTQVVIHRVFNPLTVIRGAAETLQARELDEALRTQLLDAIIAASWEIENVTLEPSHARPEECDLAPMPRSSADDPPETSAPLPMRWTGAPRSLA